MGSTAPTPRYDPETQQSYSSNSPLAALLSAANTRTTRRPAFPPRTASSSRSATNRPRAFESLTDLHIHRSRVPRRPWRLLSEDVPLIPENAVDLFPEKLGPRIFYLPSANAILKKGPTVRMAEAEAMRFIRARVPSVPVPEVYQSFMKDELGFILMEKIEGRPLSELWHELDDKQRAKVVDQLRDCVRQWRTLHGTWYGSLGGGSSIANYGDQSASNNRHSVSDTSSITSSHSTNGGASGADGAAAAQTDPPPPPPPAAAIIEPGSGPGGPCEDIVFKHLCLASPGEQKTYGPFKTRAEYNDGVVEALRNSRATGQLSDADEPLVRRIRASGVGRDSTRYKNKMRNRSSSSNENAAANDSTIPEEPEDGEDDDEDDEAEDDDANDDDDKVFTHGDLQPVNVMVDPKTLRITGILDWEVAGYSPPEREYCEARCRCGGVESGWRRALDGIFADADDLRAKYRLWRDIDWALVAHSRVWSK